MLAIRDLCLPYKLHFKTRILCHQKRCILFLYSVFNTHLRRMIAVSGAQGDFFCLFSFFFFSTEGFQPVKLEAGSYGGAARDRFRGRGRDQSDGHSTKRLYVCRKRIPWEIHGRSHP